MYYVPGALVHGFSLVESHGYSQDIVGESAFIILYRRIFLAHQVYSVALFVFLFKRQRMLVLVYYLAMCLCVIHYN